MISLAATIPRHIASLARSARTRAWVAGALVAILALGVVPVGSAAQETVELVIWAEWFTQDTMISDPAGALVALDDALAGDDVQDLVYPALERLPSTRSALERLRAGAEPEMQTFIDELLGIPNLGILPQWRADPARIRQIYNGLLLAVLTTDRPIEANLANAQAKAGKVMGS
ncbi:MAG: hypothetical protein GX573_23825 [Chloroflexi bacterium]|nr:hypothetical protein [Chloroflexota bacterium]